jgi:NADPH:quinone reductase-like Zn-dependent oxidoreductase
MKAYRMTGKGQGAVQDVAMPQLKSGQILVKVTAAACNPTDWKHRDFIAQPEA